MTAKELREVAKRVIAPPYDYGRPTREYTTDAINVAEYILANVQEDGELDGRYLTEEMQWRHAGPMLAKQVSHIEKSVGDFNCELTISLRTFSIDWPKLDDTGFELVMETNLINGTHHESAIQLPPVSTRSQFRSLMKGLGIEPKKYLKKI